jgi:pSer/pThr/pTyr-binding forkhead associated (FHA) protein
LPLRFSIRAPQDQGAGAAPPRTHAVEVSSADGEIVFGRALGVTVELPFAKVSGRHARLFQVAGGYQVEDLGSSNGTRLYGQRLAPHAPEGIVVGAVLDIGGVEVRFVSDGAGPATGAGTDTLARRLVHDLFAACPPTEPARLVVLSGPEQGRELVLSVNGRTCRLGRGEGCDLILDDVDVSREHAAFTRGPSGIVVRDLGSKNGVEVAGERLGGERVLHDGEIVRIGETRLRLFDPEDRYLRQMEAAEMEQPASAAGSGPGSVAATSGLAAGAVRADLPLPPSRLPRIASAIAVTVLALVLGLVLALAFAG